MIPHAVYCHIFPNGKVYVGITSQNPVVRWQHGSGYEMNKVMNEDIEFFGWHLIKHEVLVERAIEKDAYILEALLIQRFDATNPEKGYNRYAHEERLEGIEDGGEELLKRYGLLEYVPEPMPNALELSEQWRKDEEEYERIKGIRKIAQEQIANWTESLINPLPIYEDEEYKKILAEELKRHKEREEKNERARKRWAETYYRGGFEESEIDAYEREKWQRISQQRATYQKWRRGK